MHRRNAPVIAVLPGAAAALAAAVLIAACGAHKPQHPTAPATTGAASTTATSATSASTTSDSPSAPASTRPVTPSLTRHSSATVTRPPAARPTSSHPAPRPATTGTGSSAPAVPAQLSAAIAAAQAAHLNASIAVLDLRTGRTYAAGDTTRQFATASVVKVMIATYLLDTNQMSGQTAQQAYSMITRSDDDAATALWPKAGGTALEPWIAQRYAISNLGSPNTRAGHWGNTHITATGMAQLYAKLHADPHVWPWLGDAMHHAQRIAADGTDQFFGIPTATSTFALKQGWGAQSADNLNDAVVNTTGLIDGDSTVIVILTEGRGNNSSTNAAGFNPAQATTVSHMAQLLLPGGQFRS